MKRLLDLFRSLHPATQMDAVLLVVMVAMLAFAMLFADRGAWQ